MRIFKNERDALEKLKKEILEELSIGNRPLLSNTEIVSHKQAIEKITREFQEYRRKKCYNTKAILTE